MNKKAYVMNLWELGPEVFIAKDQGTWKILAIEGRKADGSVVQIDPSTGNAFTSNTRAREVVEGMGFAIVSFGNIQDSSERKEVLFSYNTLNPSELRNKVTPTIPMPPKEERWKAKFGDKPPGPFAFSDFVSERNLFKPDATMVQSADEARAMRNAVIAARDVLVMMNKNRPGMVQPHQIERLNRWARDWFHIAERMNMDFGGSHQRKGPPTTYIVRTKGNR